MLFLFCFLFVCFMGASRIKQKILKRDPLWSINKASSSKPNKDIFWKSRERNIFKLTKIIIHSSWISMVLPTTPPGRGICVGISIKSTLEIQVQEGTMDTSNFDHGWEQTQKFKKMCWSSLLNLTIFYRKNRFSQCGNVKKFGLIAENIKIKIYYIYGPSKLQK